MLGLRQCFEASLHFLELPPVVHLVQVEGRERHVGCGGRVFQPQAPQILLEVGRRRTEHGRPKLGGAAVGDVGR